MQSGDREKHSTRRADGTIHPSPQDLIYIVADEFHVNLADLYCENNEDRHGANGRMIVMYLGCQVLDQVRCAQLAHLLHVSEEEVYRSADTVARQMETDKALHDRLKYLIGEIT